MPKKVNIKSYALTHAKGLKASTSIAIEISGKFLRLAPQEKGNMMRFKALKKIYKRKRKVPK